MSQDGQDKNLLHRRAQAEQRAIELRTRFMDLSTQWTRLRQHFLITLGMQPPNDEPRR